MPSWTIASHLYRLSHKADFPVCVGNTAYIYPRIAQFKDCQAVRAKLYLMYHNVQNRNMTVSHAPTNGEGMHS